MLAFVGSRQTARSSPTAKKTLAFRSGLRSDGPRTSKEARMGRYDIRADAKRVFETISAGGAAILP
ncbi:hypothetical protein ACFW2K_36235, partial [Streptomyces nigra]